MAGETETIAESGFKLPYARSIGVYEIFPPVGQVRDDVHILSLRYAGTVEDQVYATLSSRFGDIFSVLGQLPDGFEDQWIDAVLRDRDAVQNFSQRVEQERPPMELRYMRDVADDRGLDWEYTNKVLSSRDLDEWMRQGW